MRRITRLFVVTAVYKWQGLPSLAHLNINHLHRPDPRLHRLPTRAAVRCATTGSDTAPGARLLIDQRVAGWLAPRLSSEDCPRAVDMTPACLCTQPSDS